jgi:hypothetical protein
LYMLPTAARRQCRARRAADAQSAVAAEQAIQPNFFGLARAADGNGSPRALQRTAAARR